MTLRQGVIFVAFVFVVGVRPSEAQCSYSVSPMNVSAASFATNSSLSVITGSSCSYGAVSSVSWITITSVTGQGLGQVNYSVAANTTGAQRVGTITVAGIVVTVTQAASSCTYSVTPTSVSVVAIGTNASVAVTTGSSCAWTSSTTTPWITITSGASGTGLGSMNYTVAANSGAARTGTMTVAGQTVTVNQAGSTTSPPPAPPTGLRIIR